MRRVFEHPLLFSLVLLAGWLVQPSGPALGLFVPMLPKQSELEGEIADANPV